MSYVHIFDHDGAVVGCSTAYDFLDYQDLPVGLGLCWHDLDDDGAPKWVVEVPMPAFDPSKHSHAYFNFMPEESAA